MRETDFDQGLCDAIKNRQCIAYFPSDGSGSRFAEPYGVTQDGEAAILLWLWEVAGTESTAPGAWTLVHLGEMRDVQVLEKTFETPRPGYIRGDKRLQPIHAQV